MTEEVPTASLGMEAMVRLTNALVSLTNEAAQLREENRQLRQIIQQERASADRRKDELPVHEEGKSCCGEGEGCQECQGPAVPEEEGEVA